MNKKQIIISLLLLISSIAIFTNCDKIEEGEYFKSVYTDRFILTEYITDAQNIDESLYNEFNSLSKESSLSIPMLVLAGDLQFEGNSPAGNQIVDQFGLNISDTITMFNRTLINSTYGVSKNNWDSAFANIQETKGEFNLEIEGDYKLLSKNFTGSVTFGSTNGYNKSLMYSVYAIEDSVVINNINLMNVLRISKNEISLVESMRRGESISMDIDFDLSYFNNNISNVRLIFVLQDANTKEILQANIKAMEGLSFSEQQKVFVEDFTGHKCGNCPAAHDVLATLQGSYGSKIVPMAIHYGFYAETDDDYNIDFTSEVGNAIGDEFNVFFTPIGMVNRTGDIGSKLINASAWDAKISYLVNQSPKVGIAIKAEIESGTINTNIYVKAFEQCDTLLKIQAFIVESNIVSKQTDYRFDPVDIEGYLQQHVLRASINENWGEDLTVAPFLKNVIEDKTYDYVLNPEWNTENLSLIVIVYNSITKEVLQVEEKHL